MRACSLRDACVTSNSWGTCGVVAGRCFSPHVDGGVRRPMRGRGLSEEPVWAVFSTQISSSVALSVDNDITVRSSKASPPRPSPVSAPIQCGRGHG
jgi:hypothetical protein